MIQRYVSKIFGPLLDRIDIHIDVPAVNYKELRGSDANAQSSAQIRERVIRARQLQLNRFAAAGERIYSNAQMARARPGIAAIWMQTVNVCWNEPCSSKGLSARGHDRILKVARTIADLQGNAQVESKHLAEAIQYRTLDRTYWT